jgi:hypothetical protein
MLFTGVTCYRLKVSWYLLMNIAFMKGQYTNAALPRAAFFVLTKD